MQLRTPVTSDAQLKPGVEFEMRMCQICFGTHTYRVLSRVLIEDSAIGLDPFGIVSAAKQHATWGFSVEPQACLPPGVPSDSLVSFGPAIKWGLVTLLSDPDA